MSVLGRAVSSIYTFFSRHQALKASTIAGGLLGGGDIISQLFVERTEKYSCLRTLRFTSIGFCFVGPVLRQWYGVLERISFKSHTYTALSRMVVDQTTLAPTMLFCFFWINGSLQGMPAASIKENLRRNYTDVLLVNYQIWPASQTINFLIIPLAHRILFAQTVGLFWNTFLAWKLNQNPENILTTNKSESVNELN